MAFHLSLESLTVAIKHLGKFGDTDVFPHLPELAFMREQNKEVANALHVLDLDTYNPGGAAEALAPKRRYGFRIVHQLPVIDTVLLLAAVIEIAPSIEAHRQPVQGIQAFSYRYSPDGKGGLFRPDRTYKFWLAAQLEYIQENLKIKHVVGTDISDYYARVSFHRLENLLDEVAPGHGAARYIKKYISVIRAKQSFGLPVGGNAARVLAELALCDVDSALVNDGKIATRFVDDFRLFLSANETPYDALAFIAELLGINEGLSLNVAKTKVYTRAEYVGHLKKQLEDVEDAAEGAAVEVLSADLYFDDELDLEKLEQLKSLNLLGLLKEEVGKDDPDMGYVKVIFRALRITKPPEAIGYLIPNFSELVMFAKEAVLLMQELQLDQPGCFDGMTGPAIKAILSPPASCVQIIRTWLLELFVRGIVSIGGADIKKLENLSGSLDRRQLYLIRGRVGDKTFFRKKKTAFDQFSVVEQPCAIWGATCLPKDEFEKWLLTVKPKFNIPAGALFIKWAEVNREKLIGKLSTTVDDAQE